MRHSRYLKLMSEGNSMNDTIAMMFSVLIVMFGYLVFKILTDQFQSTSTSTRKRSKKKGTGKPSKYPLDTISPSQCVQSLLPWRCAHSPLESTEW